jgi:outer membrane lipoprotein SlyB
VKGTPIRMKRGRLNCLFFLFWLAASAGCSARQPVLYPNERLKRMGREVAERDVNACMREGGEYVSSGGRAEEIAGSGTSGAATGAAVGAAAGAAGGAVLGHAGRGAAVGAAGGAAGGLARGTIRGLSRSRDPDPVLKNYVNRCLREKGYDVIGWK